MDSLNEYGIKNIGTKWEPIYICSLNNVSVVSLTAFIKTVIAASGGDLDILDELYDGLSNIEEDAILKTPGSNVHLSGVDILEELDDAIEYFG